MSRQLFILWIVVAFVGGNVTGCFIGVGSTKFGQEFLERMMATEKPADVRQPRKLMRPGFVLRYPRNWKIDVEDEDHDPDHRFTIESPGACYTTLILYDVASDPEHNVKEQVEHFKKLVYDSEVTKFDKWGTFSGHGSDVKGRLLGLKGGVKAFSHSTDARSFVVINLYYDEDRKMVDPGFDLIERTFTLK